MSLGFKEYILLDNVVFLGIHVIKVMPFEANEKYRGMFETQKSGNKTSSREIGPNIGTYASLNVGQDHVPDGVSVSCRHAFRFGKNVEQCTLKFCHKLG